ncbi:unnamed protein product [Ectocarpus sp. CCAP 1310/34]|nr:unnamed protein product [Ectocarpus sp. CCAP 1310/34]
MPVRRRPGSFAEESGLPCLGVGMSLAIIGALCRPRGAQSFVVVPGAAVGGVIDGTAAITAAPTVRSRGGVERCQRRPSVGGMGLEVVLRASMDDDDEFDPDAWTDELRENEGKTQGGDDMGMGVSNTVKKKRRADPKYVNAEGGENTVLELASAAQNVLDKWDEENEEEEQERKRQAEAAAAAFMVDDEEEDLGMGVSDTIPAPKSMMETLGGSDKFDKAINAMQGAEQLREMESMTAKDQKRAEMEQRGLSEEQIAAYLGVDSSKEPPKSKAEEAKVRADQAAARAFEKFNQAAFVDSSAWRAEEELLKVAPSSSLVKKDEDGVPIEDRFVYVDEYTCIGCTHCNHEAPSTFFMEEEFGRARVYQQGRDTAEAVQTAILSCPVDCIHYVDFPELVRLEKEREGISINFKAKLVGNDHDNVANGMQRISGDRGMRCDNCPSKGCYNCPMFSVGNNPEYAKRKEERKAKRIARRKKEKEELSGEIKSAEL